MAGLYLNEKNLTKPAFIRKNRGPFGFVIFAFILLVSAQAFAMSHMDHDDHMGHGDHTASMQPAKVVNPVEKEITTSDIEQVFLAMKAGGNGTVCPHHGNGELCRCPVKSQLMIKNNGRCIKTGGKAFPANGGVTSPLYKIDYTVPTMSVSAPETESRLNGTVRYILPSRLDGPESPPPEFL